MSDVAKMTEAEMREADVPWPQTREELIAYIDSLTERGHDYGTCVYAMSMAATAAFYYVSLRLGVTGFQASCADMDILRRTRRLKCGFRIINYENLLYPQYCDDTTIPGWRKLMRECADELAPVAESLLKEQQGCHPAVVAHWKKIAAKRWGTAERQELPNE